MLVRNHLDAVQQYEALADLRGRAGTVFDCMLGPLVRANDFAHVARSPGCPALQLRTDQIVSAESSHYVAHNAHEGETFRERRFHRVKELISGDPRSSLPASERNPARTPAKYSAPSSSSTNEPSSSPALALEVEQHHAPPTPSDRPSSQPSEELSAHC